MKKIIIYAYTNFNLGDDLFIKLLCNRYPKTNFILYAPKNYKTNFEKNYNLKIIPNDTFIFRGINFLIRKITKKITISNIMSKQYDASVQIGGSIFMQQENWIKALERKKKDKIKNKPFFVIGANFGPYTDKAFYLEYKNLFKTYTDICFRDKYSFDLFKDLNNVRLADDVIFQLRKKEQKEFNNSKNIVISVIKPSIRKDLVGFDDIYYQKISEIAIIFIKKGYLITLFSFCENEGDKEAVDVIKDRIPNKYLIKVNKYFYKNNIEEALDIINESKFVLATRFHAMILGWIYNKPVFPIAYSEKMTNVLKDINFEGSYTKFSDLHKLTAEDVFKSMQTNLIDISTQINNAEKQFEKLDEYLKS